MPHDTATTLHLRRGAAVALAVMLCAFVTAPGWAAKKKQEGTVSGTVTDIEDGAALADVMITLTGPDGAEVTTTTDRQGRFKVKVPAGDHVLGLAKEGYASFEARLTVEAGGRPNVTVEMLDAAAGRRSEAAKLYNAGVDAYRAGDRAAAKQSLLAAAETDPTLVEHHRLLARIYEEEGSWAEAARSAEALLAASPEDEEALARAYDAYRRLDDPRVVELRRSLAGDRELDKTLAVHAYNEGAKADQKGDSELAGRRFREALELDPGLAAAHFALASHEFRAKRFGEALAAAREGLELEPASAQGRRLAFVSLEAKGDKEAATEALEAYAEVDAEGAVEVLHRWGEADFRNGDHEAAKRHLTRLLDYRPEHAHAHRILGLVYASSDVAKAKQYLRRFLELAPEDPEAPTVREILAAF